MAKQLRFAGMTPAQRRARIAELVKDPGKRSLVPTHLLPAQYRAMRETNARLGQPIVPGSSVTNRDLAQQRKAHLDLTFGPGAEAKAAQAQKDVAGWYDQYLGELKQHRANVDTAGQQAQANLTGIGNAVRGVDQAQLTEQLKGSLADAAMRGAQVSPDVARVASDASQARQSLLGGFQAVQNAQGTGATNYADTLARVVAPGQKLQALAQAQQDREDLRRKMGAKAAEFDARVRGEEAKQVMAGQYLGLDASKAQVAAADDEFERQKDAYLREHGLGEYKPPSAPDTGKVNKYGYTEADWRALSTSERQRVIRSFERDNTKPEKAPVAGPGSLTRAEENAKVAQVRTLYDKLRNPPAWPDDKDTPDDRKGKRMTPAEVLEALKGQNIDPALLNMARSLLHNKGKLGRWGVDQAHKAGIHVNGRWQIVS